ncbi:MAG TPA: nucleotidyltransferase family protein [Bacteroidales bacterium]|nr:nucleotidyltransferase family protein [Bacteroidales bacterium]
MKAMILAAGLGTRLKPFTNYKPKALFEINGVSLLEIQIRKLINVGFDQLVVNIHHFGEQIIDFLDKNNNFGIQITISDERQLLLDTGGGIKNASHFFDDGKPFLVHNVDILSNINLMALYQKHINSDALATLAVQQRPSSRYFLFDGGAKLCGWQNLKTGETRMAATPVGMLSALAFSGIHVINPEIFPLMTETGKFSIIDVYLRLASQQNIMAYDHTGDYLTDVGKTENLAEIRQIKNLFDGSIS